VLRLSCSQWWASGIHSEDLVRNAFVPLVQRWKAAGLFDSGESAAWIADVLLKLVAVPTPIGMVAGPAEPYARRVATMLRRAFEPRDRMPRSM